jgi:hypothetical protein
MEALRLLLPFRGTWRTELSPASRVPSHGTHRFGLTHAVDFVAVDERGRSAPRTLRSLVAVEPPERFVGFGAPVLAPATGLVVESHDGEADGGGRRSPVALVPYALGQAGRIRRGIDAVTGNRVVIAVAEGGPFVVLVHLRRGSLRVGVGDRVHAGQQIAECGGSGNSTEPHLHLQAVDSVDWGSASGIPIEVGPYRRLTDGAVVDHGMPRSGERIASL